MTVARQLLGRVAFYLLVAAIAFYAVFPFYWAIVSSLKSGSALFEVEFIPSGITFQNYLDLFREQPFARNIANSLIVATLATGASILLALPAAYALGRVRFRGRTVTLRLILAVSMFPQIAVLAGLFELVRALGLYDRLTSLVLSYLILTLPFTAWVLTVFMAELPSELEDAAIVDGASHWHILTRVFVPILAPALVSVGLLAFIHAWNEFLFALTFTLTTEQRTVPVAIAHISGATAYELPWGRITAACVVVTLPLVVLVLVLQRRIVTGLAAGAVKG
jgi:trehalose/maltose transport system permease protein